MDAGNFFYLAIVHIVSIEMNLVVIVANRVAYDALPNARLSGLLLDYPLSPYMNLNANPTHISS